MSHSEILERKKQMYILIWNKLYSALGTSLFSDTGYFWLKKVTDKSGGILDGYEGQISRILAGYELIYEALLNNFQSPTIRT